MRFTEFAEDQFGTNPRRPARAGARHPRGHEPVERYHTVREFAPSGSGDSGDYLRALASAWYNGVFDTGSLPRGIKTQEDIERLLNRGIVCPDGKTRKLHIDYNSDFDGVEIYSDDYYEHGDESGDLDSRTGQPWGQYDHMEFSDDELSEGVAEGAPVSTTPGSTEPGGAVDNFKQQMANRTEIDYLKNLAGIKESRNLCNVCGQTPCNCTH